MKEKNKPRRLTKYPLAFCFCLLYKSLLMMDLGNTPRKVRNRITFISVALSGMFFYFLWEAMLISYVASPKDIQPFNSLEEFLLNTNKKVVLNPEKYYFIYRVII